MELNHGIVLSNSIPTDCAISTYKPKMKAILLAWHSPLLFDAIVIVTLSSSSPYHHHHHHHHHYYYLIIIIFIIIIIIIIIIELLCTLHIALCSCSPYIRYTWHSYELGAHKSLLVPPLSKLWFHCTSWQLLSFNFNCVLVWLADFLCTTSAINVFPLSLLLSFSYYFNMEFATYTDAHVHLRCPTLEINQVLYKLVGMITSLTTLNTGYTVA